MKSEISEIAVLADEVSKHHPQVDLSKIYQPGFPLIRNLFENVYISKEFIEVVIDTASGILRKFGKQVNPALYPAKVIFKLMPYGGRNVADKLIAPSNLLIWGAAGVLMKISIWDIDLRRGVEYAR